MMGRLHAFYPVMGLVFLLVLPTPAQEDRAFISGWGWATLGRIEGSYYYEGRHQFYDLNKSYNSDMHMGITFGKAFAQDAQLTFQTGACLCYQEAAMNRKPVSNLKKTFTPYLMQASIHSRLLERGPARLDIKGGYFSVKTNPEVQDLGDYLFRSGAYFPYVLSGFELADKTKIMGLQAGLTLFDRLRQDVFITSETEIYPLYDVSLAYLISYRPIPLIDIGAGINFSRLLSVDERKTIPAKDTLNFKHPYYEKPLVQYLDSLHADTIDATFAGTKVMARATLDLKRLFPSSRFGIEDLKVYGEIAVLGWKNYPQWYENRSQRMPMMCGFNIPTFHLLDVLALEMEYYGSPYANSIENIWERRSPIPYTGVQVGLGPSDDAYRNGRRDNWKWSLYGSRKVGRFLRISGMMANDHWLRTQGSYEDVTQVTFVDNPAAESFWPFKDWYWKFRVMVYY